MIVPAIRKPVCLETYIVEFNVEHAPRVISVHKCFRSCKTAIDPYIGLAPGAAGSPESPSVSLFDRLQDLWRSLALVPPAPPRRHFFIPDEVERLYRLDGAAGIDDQTWNDLLLESYEEKLAPQASIFARQVLHRRLRAGIDDAACVAQRARLQALMDDPARLDAIDASLSALRHADAEVAGLLFQDTAPTIPWWPRWLWLLPLALLLSLAALATQPLGWMLTLAALAPLMALQMRLHRPLEEWAAAIRALHALLRATSLLGGQGGQLLEPFVAARPRAERLHVRLARSLSLRMIPGALQYADWFAAANVVYHFKTRRIVHAERAFLRECYLACANLEADVTLARHLAAMERWCWAERGDARTLVLEGGVHPLMAQPVALSVTLQGKGAFVSGQNASGKSTFLRMVGLNAIAARAFGFCYATRACLPALPVRASMQNEDSLLGGESLYMAELRRAKELLDVAGQPPGICLIDEVFRGTNHLESVSAACAVLEQLSERDLVLVSSHNLVLAPLLRAQLAPFFIDTASGQPVLAPGVLRNPNGIALLASQGFGPRIEERAAEVARWLSSHLVEPAPPQSSSFRALATSSQATAL
ncbi:mutS domain V family protein [Massilia timonae]|uniref:MutS domain V family protein n=1 Tax=Massilia timonae TaxID=47229 RepID=A0A1S2N4U0_9BURK|nr:mutS domain V family protein [Massilia timonae]